MISVGYVFKAKDPSVRECRAHKNKKAKEGQNGSAQKMERIVGNDYMVKRNDSIMKQKSRK